MIRLLRSDLGRHGLRIWSDGDWPLDGAPAAGVAVEWAGRVGHPTSYMLIGGSPADRFSVKASPGGPLFDTSLAGSGDVVRFGLPVEYRRAVEQGAAITPDGVACEVSIAGHGEIGSSIVAFRAGTIFLRAIMDRVASLSDEDLSARWTDALITSEAHGGAG